MSSSILSANALFRPLHIRTFNFDTPVIQAQPWPTCKFWDGPFQKRRTWNQAMLASPLAIKSWAPTPGNASLRRHCGSYLRRCHCRCCSLGASATAQLHILRLQLHKRLQGNDAAAAVGPGRQGSGVCRPAHSSRGENDPAAHEQMARAAHACPSASLQAQLVGLLAVARGPGQLYLHRRFCKASNSARWPASAELDVVVVSLATCRGFGDGMKRMAKQVASWTASLRRLHAQMALDSAWLVALQDARRPVDYAGCCASCLLHHAHP